VWKYFFDVSRNLQVYNFSIHSSLVVKRHASKWYIYVADENQENAPVFTTPSPSKKKKSHESEVIARRDETPVRGSLAAKLAQARLSDDEIKSGKYFTFRYDVLVFQCMHRSNDLLIYL